MVSSNDLVFKGKIDESLIKVGKIRFSLALAILQILSLIILFSIPCTIAQSHPANQIKGGNFSNNDFEFPLNLYVNQGLTIRNGNLDLNNNALTNVDWSSTTTTNLNADTIDSQNYNSNWPTTLSNIQSATSNDFHNIGGIDDDVPEAGDFGAAADLDASGEVLDDSHNHIYSNIDSTTSSNWASIVSDETGTGSMVFSLSPTLTTPRTAEIRAQGSAGLKLYDDSGTAGVFIEDGGFVGVGITDPSSELEVQGDIEFGDKADKALLTYYSTGAQVILSSETSSWADSIRIGDGYTYFYTGGTVAMTAKDGNLGIGQSNPTKKLEVKANQANYAMEVFNDGNTADRYGIRIEAGFDNHLASGITYYLGFIDGDSSNMLGYIRSVDGVIQYSPFTGSHLATITNATGYQYGDVLCIDSHVENLDIPLDIIYNVTKCKINNSNAVLGVFAGIINMSEQLDNASLDIPFYAVNSVGDGHILVSSATGNIKIGDYLTSSDNAGLAIKQDDDLLHSYTIAKSTESINWSEEDYDYKLIKCTYHGG